MRFPDRKFDDAGSYARAYAEQVSRALSSIDTDAMNRAAQILHAAVVNDRLIFSCGNGGSAAIANHLVCDCGKGMRSDTDLKPRVFSLSCNMSVVTAIGNDLSFDEIFSFQLQGVARPGDVLITISSSGDSENIIRAIAWARDNGVPVIAMSGFSGGRSRDLADVSLHISADNYGIVEDTHQSLTHILAQYVRQSVISAELIGQKRF